MPPLILKKDGGEVRTLVLQGGGSSAFAMYLGMLKGVELDTLAFDLVLSSAAALWFAERVCAAAQTAEEAAARQREIRELQRQLLEDVDIVSLLDSEATSVVDAAMIERARRVYAPLTAIRLRDLRGMCNGRSIRFAVSEMTPCMLYSSLLVDETNAPEETLFDVVFASLSLPVIFPSVTLAVDGRPIECMDGDLSSYAGLVGDAEHVTVKPGGSVAVALYSKWKTGIPLVDGALTVVACILNAFQEKSTRNHSARTICHGCTASLDVDLWDAECQAVGEAFFDESFVEGEEEAPAPPEPTSPPPPSPPAAS
jgi:hypothetical protein